MYLFPDDCSYDVAVRSVLKNVREYTRDWYDDPAESGEWRKSAMAEVEDVIKGLQRWLFLMNHAVLIPEKIQAAKDKLTSLADTDLAGADALMREMRQVMGSLKIDQRHLNALRKELYIDESPMAQLTRNLKED